MALNDIVGPSIGGERLDGGARGIGSSVADELSTLLLAARGESPSFQGST